MMLIKVSSKMQFGLLPEVHFVSIQYLNGIRLFWFQIVRDFSLYIIN